MVSRVFQKKVGQIGWFAGQLIIITSKDHIYDVSDLLADSSKDDDDVVLQNYNVH